MIRYFKMILKAKIINSFNKLKINVKSQTKRNILIKF